MSETRFCSIDQLEGLRILGEAAAVVSKGMEAFVRSFAQAIMKNDRLLVAVGFQPAIRYKLAGSPYGRNSRGKKKWLLEQKRCR